MLVTSVLVDRLLLNLCPSFNLLSWDLSDEYLVDVLMIDRMLPAELVALRDWTLDCLLLHLAVDSSPETSSELQPPVEHETTARLLVCTRRLSLSIKLIFRPRKIISVGHFILLNWTVIRSSHRHLSGNYFFDQNWLQYKKSNKLKGSTSNKHRSWMLEFAVMAGERRKKTGI